MHKKILLAEDDNDMRRFLEKALENAGFEAELHRFVRYQYDIVMALAGSK